MRVLVMVNMVPPFVVIAPMRSIEGRKPEAVKARDGAQQKIG